MVERSVRDREVGGSNPPTPTILPPAPHLTVSRAVLACACTLPIWSVAVSWSVYLPLASRLVTVFATLNVCYVFTLRYVVVTVRLSFLPLRTLTSTLAAPQPAGCLVT